MTTEPSVAIDDKPSRRRTVGRVVRGAGAALRGARSRGLGTRRRLPVAVLAVGMAVNFVVLLQRKPGVWFWADDWDLLFLRGTIPEHDVGVLAPHNNHWFTAHILVYRVIFSLFGMGSYTPYAVTAVLVHLGIVAVTYVLLLRLRAGAWVAVLTALVIAFFGLGANAEIYAASMNHTGALLFGLIAALLTVSTRFGLRDQLLASACLLVAVMFGLTGLAMFAMVGVFVVAQHGLRRAATVVGPPALVFVAWYVTYGRSNGINSVNPTTDLSTRSPRFPPTSGPA